MPILNFDAIKKDGREVQQVGNRDIYIIKEFLTEEEQETLHRRLEGLTTEDFYNAYVEKQIKRQAKERFGSDDLDQLIKDGVIVENDPSFNWYWADKVYFIDDIEPEIRQRITARLYDYVETGYTFNGLATVQRHGKDQFLGYHYDDAHQTDIKFAVAVYVNDNYEGGEIHFPPEEDLVKLEEGGDWALNTEQLNGILIKPTKRDMIIFATTGDYVHGVRPVLSDDYRYAIVTFIR